MEKIIAIRCYAEGANEKWEAFCVDFDLAVQGSSFDEVYRKLNEQIEIYLEGISAMPPEQRKHLLNRKIPLLERFRIYGKLLATIVNRRADKQRHSYVRTESAPA